MDVLIKTASRIMFPFMLLLGSYIAIHGHLSPGGGFPAGAAIGTAIALMVLVYSEGDVEHRLTQRELVDIKFLQHSHLLNHRQILEYLVYATLWNQSLTIQR